jgi:hypothetical protein
MSIKIPTHFIVKHEIKCLQVYFNFFSAPIYITFDRNFEIIFHYAFIVSSTPAFTMISGAVKAPIYQNMQATNTYQHQNEIDKK